MHLSWRERLVQQPELRDFAAWPFLDPDHVPRHHRPQLMRNQRIVALALTGVRHTAIAAEHSVDPSYVSVLLRRSLAGDDAVDPPLTAALVPFARIRVGRRRTPLSKMHDRRGARGAFAQLLESVPNLREQLDKVICAGVRNSRHGQNLTPKSVHAEFLRLLRDAHWPTDTYPFTEEHLGYESMRRYFHRRCDALRMPKPPSRTIRSATPYIGAYQEIHIDEQSTDVHTSLHLEHQGRLIALRVARVTLILAVDVATDCYLAAQLCLTQHPTQSDLLALLRQLHAPWQPLTLTTPGLEYKPGACLPSALGEPFARAGIGIIRLDNALMHLGHRVRQYVCEQVGATLALGLPAQPKTRNQVEHAFDVLNDTLHRFRSTTGSSPQDRVREPRRQQRRPPVLTLRALEETISIVLTTHNTDRQTRLFDHSPLDTLRDAMAHQFVPLLPPGRVVDPFIERRTVPVRWLRHEHRAPHVNFEKSRYQGRALAAPDLVDQDIRVDFDIRDIRVLRAYRLTGEYLGELLAPKSWQHFPHSLTTRKHINRLLTKERLRGDDPVGNYFAYLLANKDKERHALELARVHREISSAMDMTPPAVPPNSDASAHPQADNPFQPTLDIPAWSVDLTQRS
jgi:hypothetical protein